MSTKALSIPIIQLPVSNIERSVNWYLDVLGLEFTFAYQPGDQEAWLNVNGGTGVGLIQTPDVPKLEFFNMNGELHSVVTFLVENIHDVYDTIKSKGIQVGEMHYKEGGGYSFIIEDPDGHQSCIWGGWPKNEEE